MIISNKIVKALFLCLLMGGVVACTPARKATPTYTTNSGSVLYLEDDVDSCTRSCNAEYDRCGESSSASREVGRGQFTGVFGGEAECRSTLSDCLKSCKSR